MSTLLYSSRGLRPRARRWAGWLLVALLLATLAPGISRALGAFAGSPGDLRSGGHWVELCSSEGTQWVRVDMGPADGGAATPDPEALDRCGHCTLAAERFAPLLPALPALSVAPGVWPLPTFQAWAGADAPVRAARARGPPCLG